MTAEEELKRAEELRDEAAALKERAHKMECEAYHAERHASQQLEDQMIDSIIKGDSDRVGLMLTKHGVHRGELPHRLGDEGTRVVGGTEPCCAPSGPSEKIVQLRLQAMEMALRSISTAGIGGGMMPDDTLTKRAQAIYDWLTK